MSLLLDALKKAADDKKKSVDEPADDAPVQDTAHADDEQSLELELDLDETKVTDSDAADDNEFPLVEEQPVVVDKQQPAASTDDSAEADTPLDNTTSHQQDAESPDTDITADNNPIETTTEIELAATDTTDAEDTESQRTDTETEVPTQTPPRPVPSEPVNTVSSAIHKADRSRHNTDNEAALSALINKSNQYQQRAQKKRMLLLVALILFLISGSAVFFYLKADMANQQLYIAQTNNTPLLREPDNTKQNTSPSTTDRQTSKLADANNSGGKTSATAQSGNTKLPGRTTDRPVVKSPATQSTPGKIADKSTDTTIRIQQSQREDPVELLIMDAYNAFQRGDYTQAQSRYQQALSHEANNRDAILGLAAIALKQQRYEYARQKYQSLLQLNPKDTLAIAGLSSLNQLSVQSSASSGLTESQLKLMLKEQPDAAHLYFALGSLYATKGQWPQAQSAYFSAWSGDSNNADYAFNLAVSLDHINQPQQALQYYRLSLRLMRDTAANFSAAQVQQRINSLQGAMQ